MSIQMHDKSIAKVKNIIRELIINSESHESASFFGYKKEPFEKIAKELNNRKQEFKISDLECELIFISVMENNTKNVLTSKVKSITSQTDELIDEVFTCYNSTPFEYQAEFRLQGFDLLTDIIKNPIFNIEREHNQHSSLIGNHGTSSILKIKNIGYFSFYRPRTFMKDIYQKLNTLLFILQTNKATKQKSNMYKALTYTTFMEGYIRGENGHNVNIKNINYPYMSRTISLPLGISTYLNHIILEPFEKPEHVIDKVVESFSAANLIWEYDSNEAMRIRTAMDWLINSYIIEDETMSFIQICMGLESIFGDNEYEGGLTSVLSDRCAYLIGKNIIDRKEIKKTFKEIYQIRSKIIHGVRNHLSEKEGYLRSVARTYLSMSIIREIDNLTN